MELDISDEITNANKLIRPYIRKTPLEFSPQLSELCGCEVYLKLENWQVTGSFKVRGALNKVMKLTNTGNEVHGVVTASTGNHAAAVAFALDKVKVPGTVFLPENVSEFKANKLRKLKGISLEFFGDDSVQTERKAKEYAKEQGLVYISPYNDADIIAGQGTIGYEIHKQLPDFDTVFVPVGGGGLISGIAGYLKSIKSKVEITGCQPENSAVMYESVKSGRILDIPSLPTLSDGTAGGVEENSLTFDFCRKLVDSWVLVSENEILNALRLIMNEQNMVVEGAAGLALASLIREKKRYSGKKVILIFCGRRFNNELIKRMVC